MSNRLDPDQYDQERQIILDWLEKNGRSERHLCRKARLLPQTVNIFLKGQGKEKKGITKANLVLLGAVLGLDWSHLPKERYLPARRKSRSSGMDRIAEGFPKTVKTWLLAEDKTQIWLSQQTGIDYQTLGNFLRGARGLPENSIACIEQVMRQGAKK